MLTIYEETYPIVTIQFEQAATLEDTKLYLSRFADWLDRKRNFGIIVQQSYTQQSSEPEVDQIEAVHRYTMQWAKQHKPDIVQFCVGLALMSDLDAISPEHQRNRSKTITAIFGCPGRVFTNLAEARQWIQQQL